MLTLSTLIFSKAAVLLCFAACADPADPMRVTDDTRALGVIVSGSSSDMDLNSSKGPSCYDCSCSRNAASTSCTCQPSSVARSVLRVPVPEVFTQQATCMRMSCALVLS
jgi:hypothetical protein